MFRIRFHGRGGQGLKSASRVLGSAFFAEGFEVQDAPRYGAERRGAPIVAYVRAGRQPIHERGVIERPDLVVVVDESLLGQPAAAVLAGVAEHTVLLLNASQMPDARTLGVGHRAQPGLIVLLPELGEIASRGRMPLLAAACAGAAARLSGVVSAQSVRTAIAAELSALGAAVLAHNLEIALSAYQRLDAQEGIVREQPDPELSSLAPPHWIRLPTTDLRHGAPAIFCQGSSRAIQTGLWRTERPVIDPALCKHCGWICSTFCPDGVIRANEGGVPQIDYDHCKGCLICLAECPSHAITAIAEHEGPAREQQPPRPLEDLPCAS